MKLRLILSALLLILAGAAFAQTSDLDNKLTAWSRVADDAAEIIADPDVSSGALETLYEMLAKQRAEALAAQEANSGRIATLNGQLKALGPAPEEGAVEDPEIAAQRAKLSEEIAALQVPQRSALAAYNRADGLIDEIDTIVRARFSNALMERGPSPIELSLDRLHSMGAEILDFPANLSGEVLENISDPVKRADLWNRLPLLLLLAALGLALMVYVRRALTGFLISRAARLEEKDAQRAAIAVALLALSRIVLMGAGATVLLIFTSELQLTGPTGDWLLAALPPLLAAVIGAWWLGRSLFAAATPSLRLITRADDRQAARGARLLLWAGILWGLMAMLGDAASQQVLTPETSALLNLPLVLAAALTLTRSYGLIRTAWTEKPTDPLDPEEEPSVQGFSNAFFRLLLRLAGLAALAAPLLAIFGYYAASRFLIMPQIMTLFLLSVAVLVYTLVNLFVSGLAPDSASGKDSPAPQKSAQFQLAPVIVGAALFLAAVPVLALIWGARVSDVTEFWVVLRDGITFGETRLTASDLLTFILVFGVGYSVTRLLQSGLRGAVLPKTRLDTGAKGAILAGVGYTGIFLAALAAISTTGIDLSNLAIVAGALSVGVGFGLQTMVSNFVSGIILLVERPIKQGDWIEAAGHQGIVKRISVRSTEIDTFDRASVIVPNAELIAGSVLNWTHSSMIGRVIVPIGVAYGTDPRKVERVLMRLAEEHPLILSRPEPMIVFVGFGADSMDFEIRGFVRDVLTRLRVSSDLNFAIAEAFAEEGIEIPFAQRDINLRNIDEAARALGNALHGTPPKDAESSRAAPDSEGK